MSEDHEKMRNEWPSWIWGFGFLIVVSLIASSRLGGSLPFGARNAAGFVILLAPIFLLAMSWAGFVILRRDSIRFVWRMWVALVGCVALSAAIAIPVLVILLGLDYLRLVIWIFGCGVVAFVSGLLAPRLLRFPLILGGLVMSGLVLIIPIGIL